MSLHCKIIQFIVVQLVSILPSATIVIAYSTQNGFQSLQHTLYHTVERVQWSQGYFQGFVLGFFVLPEPHFPTSLWMKHIFVVFMSLLKFHLSLRSRITPITVMNWTSCLGHSLLLPCCIVYKLNMFAGNFLFTCPGSPSVPEGKANVCLASLRLPRTQNSTEKTG